MARTYAKNIHRSWWIIRYRPHRARDVRGFVGAAEGSHGKQTAIIMRVNGCLRSYREWLLLTLGAHAQRGYSTWSVCLHLFVCDYSRTTGYGAA